MSVKQKIKEFILANYMFTDDQSRLPDEESFMQSGAMDSTGILEMIMFIEESFGIKVADEEMIPANLDSVHNVTAFVQRKLA